MVKMLGQHPLIQALPENGLVAALYKEMHNSWWSDTMLHLHCKSDANLRTERAVDAVRSASIVLPAGADWSAATDEARNSFAGVPIAYVRAP